MSSDDRHGQRTRHVDDGERSRRIPPHDLDAERGLLSSAMLRKESLEILARRVKPEDFYSPAHAHVAAAAIDLYERGIERADLLLLAARLEELGLLDQVTVDGATGRSALALLMAAPGSTSAAAHYADLVRDLHTLRRVIGAAGEIAELGYSRGPLSLDAAETVLRAQTLLADVAATSETTSTSALDFGDLDALLAGTLAQVEPDFLTRSDGQALVYAGKIHWIQGEPSSGKSWLALWAIVEVLRVGGAALYIDYEDTFAGIVGRLLALGAEPADLRDRFVYVKQDGPFGPTEKLELAARLRTLNADVVVIDSVGESMSRDGLSEDAAPDVIAWVEKLPRWVSRTGAAVIVLDHVTKDREHRGRWARGSGAKLGAPDGAVFELVLRESFSRKKAGRFDLKIAKDRPGGVGEIGAFAASVTLTPHADGERVVIEVGPPAAPSSTADPWKPTILMRKVSDELEHSVVPLTAKAIVDLIGGKKDLVREAIARLKSEGWIREVRMGSTPILTLARPYREEDPPPPRPEPPPTLDLDNTSNVVVGPWESLSQYDRDRVLLDGADHIEDPNPEGDQ